jgi:hypothetical protein
VPRLEGGNSSDGQRTGSADRHAVAVSERLALLLASLRGAVRDRIDLVAEPVALGAIKSRVADLLKS